MWLLYLFIEEVVYHLLESTFTWFLQLILFFILFFAIFREVRVVLFMNLSFIIRNLIRIWMHFFVCNGYKWIDKLNSYNLNAMFSCSLLNEIFEYTLSRLRNRNYRIIKPQQSFENLVIHNFIVKIAIRFYIRAKKHFISVKWSALCIFLSYLFRYDKKWCFVFTLKHL